MWAILMDLALDSGFGLDFGSNLGFETYGTNVIDCEGASREVLQEEAILVVRSAFSAARSVNEGAPSRNWGSLYMPQSNRYRHPEEGEA